MAAAFEELMALRALPAPTEMIERTGSDPVLPTRFALGETGAAILAAIGVAVNDIWEQRTGKRQNLSVDAVHAAAALRSYHYLKTDREANWASQQSRQRISTPHPTRDGRYFLPHMGLPHLAERILGILGCDYTLESVVDAVSKWDALELEEAVAAANGCGAMVRSEQEWRAHPQGRLLSERPVIEIFRIGDADPEPMPEGPSRPLEGLRVLDLTRILAGPTCARTLAEHGADVLMVTAKHLPQSEYFVMDTSHGKRTCYLDLDSDSEKAQLKRLIADADVFSQGYRTNALAARGLSPGALAELRPGIIYTSMNCYGFEGPFAERAGWEQLAQTVTGIAAEQGGERPTLLPAAACDYTTGYLAAYGTLVALGLRARIGGSWHVRASLCQSGMFIQRQPRTESASDEADISQDVIDSISQTSRTPYGDMRHLAPVLRMSETPPHWELPSSPLGTHEARWR